MCYNKSEMYEFDGFEWGETMQNKTNIAELRKEKKAVLARETKARTLTKTKRAQIESFFTDEEEIEHSFGRADNWKRGPIIGRPKKEIKREAVTIRVSSDALKIIKSLGRGWSTRAGDALAELARKGLL